MASLKLASYQIETIRNPYQHFCFYAGVGTGKTHTGAYFAIDNILRFPEQTGFIGANSYDQLSQATLFRFFEELDKCGLDFVVDCRPPKSWGCKRAFKTYTNTIHVRNPRTKKVTTVFTRVMSEPDAFRGIEITWYWIDELRDTDQYAHDVLVGRCRETPGRIKGLATSTTNGEGWDYKRFVLGNSGNMRYGSMHVPTMAAVQAGFLGQDYFDSMLGTYSPMMAEQELFARHVNVLGGRAYYAASERNRLFVSPWGDTHPNPSRPLIIGCDFNFSPAPCVWMVGQIGPEFYGPDGQPWWEQIHWFGEVSEKEISTPDMTRKLLGQFPGFFYKFYGDVSGGVGTTSNAGVTDYEQINQTCGDAGVMFSIDYFQADPDEARINPRVRTRVENMNTLFVNGLGRVRQTYNPNACPLFDGDMKMVGWKEVTMAGRGKLDDGGDKDRTHGSDGAGYAMMKIFPPTRRAQHGFGIPSAMLSEIDHVI